VSSLRHALAAHRVVRTSSAVGLVSIGLSLAAAPAVATDYEFNPWIKLGAGYDENITLASSGGNQISAADAIVDARVELLAQELNWKLIATPEVRGTWFPSQSNFNSNGEFLNLDAQHTGERSTLTLDGYGASQALLTGYLPTANIATPLGVPEPSTTLGTPTSIRQNVGSLTPTYTFQMTPRSSLQFNANYTDVTYNHNIGGDIEYQNATGSAGLVLAASPTGSLTVRATAAGFRPDSGRTADTYGPELQWDGKFSETKEYYLRAGVDRTDFSGSVAGSPLASSSTNWSGGAGTHWTYSLTEIFVDATRIVAPTQFGYAVNQDELRLRLARRLTPRFAAFLGLRAIYEDPLSGAVAPGPAARAQHYNYATTGFEWRLQRQFSVVCGFSLTEYHYIAPAGQSNSIQLSVVYEPNRPAEGPAITVGY
jgi:hypothetical protein